MLVKSFTKENPESSFLRDFGDFVRRKTSDSVSKGWAYPRATTKTQY